MPEREENKSEGFPDWVPSGKSSFIMSIISIICCICWNWESIFLKKRIFSFSAGEPKGRSSSKSSCMAACFPGGFYPGRAAENRIPAEVEWKGICFSSRNLNIYGKSLIHGRGKSGRENFQHLNFPCGKVGIEGIDKCGSFIFHVFTTFPGVIEYSALISYVPA